MREIFIQLCLPPANALCLFLLGFLTRPFRKWFSRFLVLLAMALLYVCSTPYFAKMLVKHHEAFSPLDPNHLPESAQAIVVLSAARVSSPEFPGQINVNIHTLERIQYASWLHEKTGLPLAIAGGRLSKNVRLSESEMIKDVLRRDFKVDVMFAETKSKNTWENAKEISKLLKDKGIHQVFLVTEAWHMPRAVLSFQHQDIVIIPAPTHFLQSELNYIGPLLYIPNATALEASALVIRETVGYYWYKLHYNL